jgi:hypothetical protein
MAGYNGWTNRETWVVNLHYGDAFYIMFDDYVKNDYGSQFTNEGECEKPSVEDVVQFLKDYWDEFVMAEIKAPDVIRDLINDNAINWHELAETLITDYDWEDE